MTSLNFITLRLLLVAAFFIPNLAAAIEPMKPTRKIDVNGTKIAVYESSGQRGPGVLLIHGNTSSSNSYAKFMKSQFALRNRVVAMDLPGYGNSDRIGLYNVKAYRDAIAAVAKATKVDSGVVVGWSWGGDLALQAILKLPKAKGVFIFGTGPIGGEPKGAPPAMLKPNESYAGLAVTYGVIPFLTPGMIRKYVRSFFAPNYTDIPNFLFEDGYKAANGTRTAVAVVGLGLDFTHNDEVTIAKNLKIPLAMVHASEDAFVRYEYLQAIESSLPTLWTGQTVLVEGHGHALQWEAPDKFGNLLQDFIDDL